MVNIVDQVIRYVQENPTVVAGVCFAVLIVGVTQAVVSASLLKGGLGGGGVLTDKYAKYILIARTRVSHNSWVYRFGLSSENAKLGLPLGQHISLRTHVDGEEIRRPYTPISGIDTRGYFELLVKTYPEPHGKMSRHLESLALGNSMEVRGPLGRFKYQKNKYTSLGMIAGGTGITPCWQVLQHILNDPSDTTKISLIFANVTEGDILLYSELNQLALDHREQFDVYYVLNDPPANWSGGTGFVSKEIIQERFGDVNNGTLALMCGPPPMNKAMRAALTQVGYTEEQIFKF